MKAQTKPMESTRVALFDFCDTLVGFQSADEYIRYTIERLPRLRYRRVYQKMHSIMVKTHTMRIAEFIYGDASASKQIRLKQLKGVSCDALADISQSFYRTVIKPNLIPETTSRLCKLKESGYRIIIVSGGFDIYLNLFCEDYGIEKPVCTKLKMKNGKFTGHYDGPDCMGQAKLAMLNEVIDVDKLQYCDSIAFSDSRSDTPMLRACKRGIVVYRSAPTWALEEGFGVIQWNA